MSTKVVAPESARRSTPLIDPRLRDRRIEVARGQGRTRRRRIIGLVVVAAIVAIAAIAVRSSLLDVDTVAVRGASATDAEAARVAAAIPLGQAMIAVDAGAAARRVEDLPWIEQASVTRTWPGTITIEVVERTPVATVGTGSDAMLVDADGRSLGPVGEALDLPVIAGTVPVAGQELGAGRRAVAATLAELPVDLRRDVKAARASSAGIVLTLQDDIKVRWGDDSQQTAKSDALRILLDQADRATIASIDVSVPRATTLTRQTGGA